MKSGYSIFLFAYLALEAQAATLIDNVQIYSYNYPYPNSFALDYHGYAEAVFTPYSEYENKYFYSFLGIAEGYEFFEVNLGDLVDPGFLGRFTPFRTNSILTIDINESKYLGYWAGVAPEPYYGWVKVTHTSTGLVASESATSEGRGIYVGSFAEIPEPSAPVLWLAAMTLLLRRRRITIN